MNISGDMIRRHPDKFVEANGDITREWKSLLVFLVEENEKLHQRMDELEKPSLAGHPILGNY